jgi:hypothetical protein
MDHLLQEQGRSQGIETAFDAGNPALEDLREAARGTPDVALVHLQERLDALAQQQARSREQEMSYG